MLMILFYRCIWVSLIFLYVSFSNPKTLNLNSVKLSFFIFNISLSFIKETFELYRNFIFTNYGSAENYPLYQLVKDNWEEKTPKIHFESYIDDRNNKKKSGNLKNNTIKNKLHGIFFSIKKFKNKNGQK